MTARGRVLLVGAGPGDPDLVTIKALRALARADVVLVDALVSEELRHAAPRARWVDVGKRRGAGASQAGILRQLVQAALDGNVVVRLKGGDPLTFGRAAEELAACARAGIPVEVVPGVSAAQAAAAAAAIPLTTRDSDPWVLLVPGQQATGKDGPRVPWDRVAALGGTVAIYMCVETLEATVGQLLLAGRSSETPVTLVSQAGLPEQAVLRGRLGDLAAEARRIGIEAPAVLLVHQGPPLPEPPRTTVAAALVTHRSADLAELEALRRVPAEELRARAAALPAVREAVVLSTCHRVEVYVATDTPEQARPQLEALLQGAAPGRAGRVHWREGADAAGHLLRVASGLESLVLGESQVLGQVREALDQARSGGTAGPHLGPLFEHALAAGRRVRSETGLGRGAVGVGSAAARLAERELGSLPGRRAVVVGTGETATLAAQALRDAGCHVTIAGRRSERTQALAARVGARAIRVDDVATRASETDLFVYATGCCTRLLDATERRTWLAAAPRGPARPLVVLDLGNPRNVDPAVAGLAGVRLVDLDALRAVRHAALAGRRSEAARARRILAEELRALEARRAAGPAEQVLREVYSRMGPLAEREASRALRRLGPVGDREREVVADMADSIVRKVLDGPASTLRTMARGDDRAGVRVAARLFGVSEVNDVPGDEAQAHP